MTKTVVTLDDKYLQETGQVMLSSLQAVVRLLLDQSRRDKAAGLRTAGYVTGYRGSPITTLDAQLWAVSKLLDAHDIRFEPGLNEELAATSLRGTQELPNFGKPRVDGVFSLWYAKGVGVDRACEALKLDNFGGTSAKGGVLVMAGDDHAAKSSLSAHQSEHTLIAGFIPILYPATTDDLLSFGQLGWAMSRASGLYAGLKTVTDTLDLTTTVTLPDPGFPIVMPEPPAGVTLHSRPGASALEQEAVVVQHRLPMAQRFALANHIDRITVDSARRTLTIVSAGKAWLDVNQALLDLGLTPDRCAAMGLRVVKMGLIWPIEPSFAADSCAGSAEVLVVEEKRPVMEEQLARIFYALPGGRRPVLSGKQDPEGKPLLSSVGVLDAGQVRRALMARLEAHGLVDDGLRARAAALATLDDAARGLSLTAIRPAYFCSGCPHNTSTVVPEGSNAMGATGCHGLAVFIPGRRTMQTVGMGAEGMPWVAAQSFVDTPHMFQNLGDGTYTHSGLLTIRASVAAKSNVTFKILYNDAVAMTGGQPAEGALTPEQIVRELVVEGCKPVVLVSEDPSRFDGVDLPSGVRVLHRDHLDEVQRELREIKGTSAIIYEQTCSNEKRRRRKRGDYPDPDRRLFINTAVCEGCGDCSKQSNCLSIQPVETEFGRKRMIDQSTCNKDFSCIKGFCPSFVTVEGGKLKRRALDLTTLAEKAAALPAPPVLSVEQAGHAMLVTGIGGTGVLTVGAVLAMAAHMEGKAAKVLDMTGMAQKGGAVTSHIRIGADVDAIPSARLGTGQSDLILACDLVVASAPDVLASAHDSTRMVANEDIVPTGEFQTNQSLDLTATRFLRAVEKRIEPGRIDSVRASALATRLLGDSIFTNLLMVGFAAQRGLLPVSIASIEEAVRLNGVAVKANLEALLVGRIAADDPDFLFRLAGTEAHDTPAPDTLEGILASRMAHLTGYQNEKYANAYKAFVDDIAARLVRRGVGDAQPFLIEVARYLAKLMAYKDEYEVARLYAGPAFRQALSETFEGELKLSFNLASPLLFPGKDARTGRPAKRTMGPWMLKGFGLLQHFKGLRGGLFDIFGHTAERHMERALIGEYRALIEQLADAVVAANLPLATRIAALPALIAGYGPVKEEGVANYRTQLAELMDQFRNSDPDASRGLARSLESA